MNRMHIPGLRVIWGVRHSEGISLHDTPVLWITYDEVASFIDPTCGEIIDTTCVESHRFYVEQPTYTFGGSEASSWSPLSSSRSAYEQVKAELLGTEEAGK